MAQFDPIKSHQKEGKPLILAHRGLVAQHQENTLAAIMAALADPKCNGAEFDVHMTADEQLMVVHDLSTLRLTGVDFNVNETAWADMRDLTIQKDIEIDGEMWHFDKTEKFCLLADVLEEIKGKDFVVDIDTKPAFPTYGQREQGAHIAKMVRDMGVAEQVIGSSINFFALYCMEKEYKPIFSGFQYDPEMPLSARILNYIMERNLVGHFIYSNCAVVHHELIDEDSIQHYHKRNMPIGSYTLFPLRKQGGGDDEKWASETKRLSDQKIDWLECDYPAKAYDVVWGA